MRRPRLSVRRLLLVGVIVLIPIIALVYITSQPSQPPATPSNTITTAFDFDTGSPLLAATQSTPFNQTSNGITAHFGSPSDTSAPAFSIQSYSTTFVRLAQFSGKYLYDNQPSRDILEIRFSQQLKSISLTFATVEYRTEPSSIVLTAYLDSAETTPVGQATTNGTSTTELYPQGTVSYNSDGHPFNIVRIEIPLQESGGATNFFVDNIKVNIIQKEPSTK